MPTAVSRSTGTILNNYCDEIPFPIGLCTSLVVVLLLLGRTVYYLIGVEQGVSDTYNVGEHFGSPLARFQFGYDGMFRSSGRRSSVFCIHPMEVEWGWPGLVGSR